MITLTDFLLARIAEDKAVARAALDLNRRFDGDGGWTPAGLEDPWPEEVAHITRHDPARVLAECKAKRRIVEQAEEASADRAQVIGEFCVGKAESDAAHATDPGDLILKAVASVYADHPDFDPAWRV